MPENSDDRGAPLSWASRVVRSVRRIPGAWHLWMAIRWLPFLKDYTASARAVEKERIAKQERVQEEANRFRDLPAIATLSLPRNETFFSIMADTNAIEGMLSDFSLAVTDSLLSLQDDAGIKGNLLELGVYKGRSAALLGAHLRSTERLVLVDILDQLNREAIAPFEKSVDYIIGSTENIKASHPEYFRRRRGYRFIHIDASHAYRPTLIELQLAEEMLAPRGIIAVDDFTNVNYLQNTAAIFKYLYSTSTDLALFLATEKAFLCRKSDLIFYLSFVLDRLLAEMGSREQHDVVLARTDIDPEYSAFAARKRNPGEEGHFYAPDIYGNLFLRP